MSADIATLAGGRILDYLDLADEVVRLRAALGALVERTPTDHDQSEAAYCAYCSRYLSSNPGEAEDHHPDCEIVRARAVLAEPFPALPIRDELAASGFRRVAADDPAPRLYNPEVWEVWRCRERDGRYSHLIFPLEDGPSRDWWTYERKARDFLRAMRAIKDRPRQQRRGRSARG